MIIKGAISFIAFGVMIVFALGSFRSMGVALNPPPDRTHLSMQVKDISGLVLGSSVQLLGGVPIGEINRISTTTAGATVDLAVDSQYEIPVDSDIRLETLSALGEAYVEVIPRSEGGPALQDGQVLDTEVITQPLTISELATTVVRVLNQLNGRTGTHRQRTRCGPAESCRDPAQPSQYRCPTQKRRNEHAREGP